MLGGYHATFMMRILNSGLVDYIVRGEGEYIFPQLVKVLENNEFPHSVLGISFRRRKNCPHSSCSSFPQP